MKFAVAALLATTSAIRIEKKGDEGCVDHELARQGFKALDTNKDGSLSYDEIKVGIEELAKHENHTITKEEWEWMEKTGKAIDTKTPGKVDEREFWEFANAVFEHFDLCHLARHEEVEEAEHGEGGCVDRELAEEGFEALDTNHNGSLSYDEIKKGLEELAASQKHKITDEEWKWIEATGKAIDTKTPGKVDKKEFWEFANAVFEHFGLCHLAEEEEHDCDLSAKDAEEAFKYVDKNADGTASAKEVRKALKELAAHYKYKLTKEDKRWLRRQFKRDGGKKDGGLDEKEFHEFANAVSNHW